MAASKKKYSSRITNALAPVGGAETLPTIGAPAPPVGWIAVKVSSIRKVAPPYKTQIEQATSAIEELRASDAYAKFLGPKVPPADAIANALDFSAQWSREVVAAEAWLEFAKVQATLAWNFTLGQLEAVKAPLALETARDPSFANELVSFKSLVTARGSAAKRGGVNRVSREQREAKRKGATSSTEPAAKPTTTTTTVTPDA